MLGRTHVALSTATAHAGLAAYTTWASTRLSIDGSVHVDVFGVHVGLSLDPLHYVMVSAAVLFLALLLLRVGKRGFYPWYALLSVGALAFLWWDGQRYPLELALMGMAFTLGSLLPDVDEPTSTIGRYVPFVGAVLPHRTFTHTAWAVMGLAGLAWWLHSPYVAALAVGYFGHVLQDSFSKQGICWLYPVIGKYTIYGNGAVMKEGRRSEFYYRTGGVFETTMFFGALALHVACGLYVIQHLVLGVGM